MPPEVGLVQIAAEMSPQKSTLSSTPLHTVDKRWVACGGSAVLVVVVRVELVVVVVESSQLLHMVGHNTMSCGPTNGSSHADAPIKSH
jgi:hypothetical protein